MLTKSQIWILSRSFKVMVNCKREPKQQELLIFKDTANNAILEQSSVPVNTKLSNIYKLIKEIIAMIAKPEPQAAYTCFMTAFKHNPSYIMRTIHGISYQLNQLDDVTTPEVIPEIKGGIYCSIIEGRLLSLP